MSSAVMAFQAPGIVKVRTRHLLPMLLLSKTDLRLRTEPYLPHPRALHIHEEQSIYTMEGTAQASLPCPYSTFSRTGLCRECFS